MPGIYNPFKNQTNSNDYFRHKHIDALMEKFISEAKNEAKYAEVYFEISVMLAYTSQFRQLTTWGMEIKKDDIVEVKAARDGIQKQINLLHTLGTHPHQDQAVKSLVEDAITYVQISYQKRNETIPYPENQSIDLQEKPTKVHLAGHFGIPTQAELRERRFKRPVPLPPNASSVINPQQPSSQPAQPQVQQPVVTPPDVPPRGARKQTAFLKQQLKNDRQTVSVPSSIKELISTTSHDKKFYESENLGKLMDDFASQAVVLQSLNETHAEIHLKIAEMLSSVYQLRKQINEYKKSDQKTNEKNINLKLLDIQNTLNALKKFCINEKNTPEKKNIPKILEDIVNASQSFVFKSCHKRLKHLYKDGFISEAYFKDFEHGIIYGNIYLGKSSNYAALSPLPDLKEGDTSQAVLSDVEPQQPSIETGELASQEAQLDSVTAKRFIPPPTPLIVGNIENGRISVIDYFSNLESNENPIQDRIPMLLSLFDNIFSHMEHIHASGKLHKDFNANHLWIDESGQIGIVESSIQQSIDPKNEDAQVKNNFNIAPIARMDDASFVKKLVSRATDLLQVQITFLEILSRSAGLELSNLFPENTDEFRLEMTEDVWLDFLKLRLRTYLNAHPNDPRCKQTLDVLNHFDAFLTVVRPITKKDPIPPVTPIRHLEHARACFAEAMRKANYPSHYVDQYAIKIPKFFMEKRLGEGAFGIVMECTIIDQKLLAELRNRGICSPTGNKVVVKKLKGEPDQEKIAEFFKEGHLSEKITNGAQGNFVGCAKGAFLLVDNEYVLFGKLEKMEPVDYLNSLWANEVADGSNLTIIAIDDVKKIDENVWIDAQETGTPILIKTGDKCMLYGDPEGDGNWQLTEIKNRELDTFINKSKITSGSWTIKCNNKLFTPSLINSLKSGHAEADRLANAEDREQLLLKMFDSLMMGREYLGTLGILHKDIAARNTLMTEDGRVVLSDWGLSEETNPKDENAIFFLKSEIGSLKWMNMEFLVDKQVSRATDLFSTKITMLEFMAAAAGWDHKSIFPPGDAVQVAIYHMNILQDDNKYIQELKGNLETYLNNNMHDIRCQQVNKVLQNFKKFFEHKPHTSPSGYLKSGRQAFAEGMKNSRYSSEWLKTYGTKFGLIPSTRSAYQTLQISPSMDTSISPVEEISYTQKGTHTNTIRQSNRKEEIEEPPKPSSQSKQQDQHQSEGKVSSLKA